MTEIEVAQIGKALGDPSRLGIYLQIAQHKQKEIVCGDICAHREISSPTVSHHLKVLHDLGLIGSRKEGLNVYYWPEPKRMAEYVKYLSGLGDEGSASVQAVWVGSGWRASGS